MNTFINTLTTSILLLLVYLSVGATGPLLIVGTALYWVYAVILTILVLMLPFLFTVNKTELSSKAFSPLKIVINVSIDVLSLVVFAYAGWTYAFAMNLVWLLAYIGLYFKYKGV